MPLSPAFIHAIKTGNKDFLNANLTSNNLNDTTEFKEGIVEIALQNNQPELALEIFKKSEYDKQRPAFALLIHAIRLQQSAFLAEALKIDSVKNCINNQNIADNKNTPLFYAIQTKNIPNILKLVEYDANLLTDNITAHFKNKPHDLAAYLIPLYGMSFKSKDPNLLALIKLNLFLTRTYLQNNSDGIDIKKCLGKIPLMIKQFYEKPADEKADSQTNLNNLNIPLLTAFINLYQNPPSRAIQSIINDFFLALQSIPELKPILAEAYIEATIVEKPPAQPLHKNMLEFALDYLEKKEIPNHSIMAKISLLLAKDSNDPSRKLHYLQQSYKLDKSTPTLYQIIKLQHELHDKKVDNSENELIAQNGNLESAYIFAADNLAFPMMLSLFQKTKQFTWPANKPLSASIEMNQLIANLNYYSKVKPLLYISKDGMTRKYQVQNAIGEAFKNYNFKEESLAWFFAIFENNPTACVNYAEIIETDDTIARDLPQAVFFYNTAYQSTNPALASDIRSDVVNRLVKIAKIELPIADEKGALTPQQSKDARGIFTATVSVLKIVLTENSYIDEQNIGTLKQFLELAVLALTKIPSKNAEQLIPIFDLIIEQYKKTNRALIRDEIVAILKEIKYDTASTILACYHQKIIAEKNLDQASVNALIQLYKNRNSIAEKDLLQLDEIILTHAVNAPQNPEIVLLNYRSAYFFNKKISTLVQVAAHEFLFKQIEAANTNCQTILNSLTDAPATTENITLLNTAEKFVTHPNLKKSFILLKNQYALEKFKATVNAIPLLPSNIKILLKHFDESKNEQQIAIARAAIDSWVTTMLQNDSIELYNSIPFNYLIDKEIHEQHAVASDILKKLTQAPSNKSWQSQITLLAYYQQKITILSHDPSNQAAIDEANSTLEKALFLEIELFKNKQIHTDYKHFIKNQHTWLNFIRNSAFHSKNKLIAEHLFRAINPKNYSKQDLQVLAKEHYIPAIFELAAIYESKTNAFGNKSRTKRAISLYLSGSAFLIGLSDKDAAKILHVAESQIHFWRDSAAQFLESITENKNHKYNQFAQWARNFIDLLTNTKMNLLNANLNPNAAIVLALNHWNKVSETHSEGQSISSQAVLFKQFFLESLKKSFNATQDEFLEKKLTAGIAFRRIIKFFETNQTTTNAVQPSDSKLDTKQMPSNHAINALFNHQKKMTALYAKTEMQQTASAPSLEATPASTPMFSKITPPPAVTVTLYPNLSMHKPTTHAEESIAASTPLPSKPAASNLTLFPSLTLPHAKPTEEVTPVCTPIATEPHSASITCSTPNKQAASTDHDEILKSLADIDALRQKKPTPVDEKLDFKKPPLPKVNTRKLVIA